MKLEILLLGRTKDGYLEEGIKDYLRRLSHYTPCEIVQLKVKKQTFSQDDQQRRYESDLLATRQDPGSYLVALDSTGRQISSEELAALLEGLNQRGIKKAVFSIGGPVGLHREQLDKADLILSLSRLTFTHDMTRLILLEQLYRAYTISAGTGYHK